MKKEKKEQQNIVLYQAKNGKIEFRNDTKHDTIWASQKQIASIFDVNRTVVTRHINNILKDKEVNKSNVQKMHIAGSDKPVKYYSLDIILAVGYRTNSAKAIKFRIWATTVLKKHLVDGYTLNKKRLEQQREQFMSLQQAVTLLKHHIGKPALDGQQEELLSLLEQYGKTILLLDEYDSGTIKKPKTRKATKKLTREKVDNLISEVQSSLYKNNTLSELFGRERGKGMDAILGNLYQTFGGKELYPTIVDKAASLLYFVIKNHPFSDGNKRLGSLMFVYFLDMNNFLTDKNGARKINDNALTALALLIAESNPKEKDLMIALVMKLIV